MAAPPSQRPLRQRRRLRCRPQHQVVTCCPCWTGGWGRHWRHQVRPLCLIAEVGSLAVLLLRADDHSATTAHPSAFISLPSGSCRLAAQCSSSTSSACGWRGCAHGPVGRAHGRRDGGGGAASRALSSSASCGAGGAGGSAGRGRPGGASCCSAACGQRHCAQAAAADHPAGALQLSTLPSMLSRLRTALARAESPSLSLPAVPPLQEFQRCWVAWNPLAKSFQQPLTASSVAAIEARGHRVSAASLPGLQHRGALVSLAALSCSQQPTLCAVAHTCNCAPHPTAPPPAGLHRAHRAGQRGELCHAARRFCSALPLPLPRPARRQRRPRAGPGETPVHAPVLSFLSMRLLERVCTGCWGSLCCWYLSSMSSSACPAAQPSASRQVTVTKGTDNAAVVVKSDDAAAADLVLDALRNCLLSF